MSHMRQKLIAGLGRPRSIRAEHLVFQHNSSPALRVQTLALLHQHDTIKAIVSLAMSLL